MNIGGSISGAVFGPNSRFALWRIWDAKADALLFIGLNPSRANGVQDDPTIRRLVSLAKKWGFGGLYAGNLFSYISPIPTPEVFNSPTGGPTDEAIRQMKGLSTVVLAGWGNWGVNLRPRIREVLALVGGAVNCVGVNKTGEPAHPLYFGKGTTLKPFHYYGRGNNED